MIIPALALLLTACTGGADKNGDGSDAENGTGNGSVVEVTETPGTAEGYTGALEDAEQTRCEASGDAWVSEGTLTNPTETAQSYRVYVSFMSKNDTRGLVQADVAEIAPGESAPWAAEAALTDDALECVLRVERFEP